MADDGETTTWAHHRMGRGEVLAAHAVGRDRPKWPGKSGGQGHHGSRPLQGRIHARGGAPQTTKMTHLSLGWTKGRGELVRAAPAGVPLSFI